jgi:hypothetical protein
MNHTKYLLAELRCAALRAHLAASDLEAIGLALRGQLITAEQAIDLIDEVDCMRFVGVGESKEAAS